MSRHIRVFTAQLAAALALLLAAQASQAQNLPLQLSSYPSTQLRITLGPATHPGKTHLFEVWVADTPERAEQGLMFVSDLPDNKGMVFPLDPPRVEHMWMKNTYIELDMLFVRTDGRVTKIIERAHPLSLDTLSSESAVAAVIELRGGLAAKLGLKVGDLVRWGKPASS